MNNYSFLLLRPRVRPLAMACWAPPAAARQRCSPVLWASVGSTAARCPSWALSPANRAAVCRVHVSASCHRKSLSWRRWASRRPSSILDASMDSQTSAYGKSSSCSRSCCSCRRHGRWSRNAAVANSDACPSPAPWYTIPSCSFSMSPRSVSIPCCAKSIYP